jgi:hypothetical protein
MVLLLLDRNFAPIIRAPPEASAQNFSACKRVIRALCSIELAGEDSGLQ